MSRIGSLPIPVPSGVKVEIDHCAVHVKGPKGELSQILPKGIQVRMEDAQLNILSETKTKVSDIYCGLARSLCFNMVKGVTVGFSKDIEIQGVGFRAKLEGKVLVLSLGFSHPVKFQIPAGIQIEVQDQVKLKISGIDKQMVGQTAATIRRYYPAEPYKGKGIRYLGEVVKRKAGKTVTK
ncbi:MAG: 50S ribosomal protein L6 [Chlamydiota bacterium]|nr:50S ribosomal protein L6 [Chlamydiota bacterium]